MPHLTGIVRVEDADGNNVAQPDANGVLSPIVLALGNNLSAAASPNGGTTRVTISAANSPAGQAQTVPDLATLRTKDISTLSDGTTIVVASPPDTWILTKTTGAGTADDGFNIVKPALVSQGSNGRWRASHGGPVPVTWFGADPTNNLENATAFTTAANASRHIIIPPGNYKLAAGWMVPRAGVTIELSCGAVLNIGGMIATNFPNVAWIGHSIGRNFFSDGFVEPHANVVWTNGAGQMMGWATVGGVSCDGCYMTGLFLDGGSSGLASGDLGGILVGTAGSGSSGMQFDHFGCIDVPGRAAGGGAINFRTNFEQCAFHQPYLGFRAGVPDPLPPLGIGLGADPSGSFSITSSSCCDWGGSVSGYQVGVQIGGSGGTASTLDFGGDERVVIETIAGSGGIGVLVYNGLASKVRGLHVEVHPVTIHAATGNGVNPIVCTTDRAHNLPNGCTVHIHGALGNTAMNGDNVATVTGPTAFTIPVMGNGVYTADSADVQDVSNVPNAPIYLGHLAAVPEGTEISGNYLSGVRVAAIIGVNWDSFNIHDNLLECSGALNAFKVMTGGGRRVNGTWGTQLKVARGADFVTDISDRSGFDYVFPQDRAANNEALPEIWTSGRVTPQSAYTFGSNGTPVPGYGTLQLGKSFAITDVSNTTPIVVHCAGGHNVRNLDGVHVAGNSAANGDWFVTYVDPTHFSLNGSVAGGAVSGGTAYATSAFVGVFMNQFDITMADGVPPVFRMSNGTGLLLFARDPATAAHPRQIMQFQMDQKGWDTVALIERNFPFLIATTITTVQANPVMSTDIFSGPTQLSLVNDANGQHLRPGDVTTPGWYVVTGVPNFVAPVGSIATRKDGNAGATFYVNEGTGVAGNTNNWVPK